MERSIDELRDALKAKRQLAAELEYEADLARDEARDIEQEIDLVYERDRRKLEEWNQSVRDWQVR